MRVLALLTDAYGGRGGIAQANRNFCAAFNDLPECADFVILPRLILEPLQELPGKATVMVSAANSKWRYLVTLLRLLWRDRAFDLIFCGHINLMPAAYLAKWFCKARALLVLHGIEAWRSSTSPLLRRLIGHMDCYIAVSTVTLERFRAWSRVDERLCAVIPNVFHAQDFAPGAKNPALVERYQLQHKRVLLTMARYSATERYKGVDEMLEALPKLLQTHSDLIYLIAGDGNDIPRLQAKVEALGIAGHVRFAGWISADDKSDYFRLADVFVMPGRGEGFGIVYLEALACGIPVVGSILDGSRDALRNGELGVLVNPDDAENLMTGIEQALSLPKQVPPGLDYFRFEQLVSRLRAFLMHHSIIVRGLKSAV